MKRLLIIIILCVFQLYGTAQTTVDSVKTEIQKTNKRVDTIAKKIDTITKKTDSIKKAVDTLVAKNTSTAKCPCKDVPVTGRGNWLLVFLPVLVFAVIFALLLIFGLNKFDMKGALAESEYPKITIPNPQYTSANLAALNANDDLSNILPPTMDVSNIPPAGNVVPPTPSISRYIAFITSILTLVVALCMTCFFIYYYIRTGCAPDLSPLSTILIALGVGVVPYVFNKVSSAIAKNKSE